jgi:Bacterial virulence factor lipase N-terminal
VVLFQLAQGIFPFPNDFYFAGSTDGSLNLPANGLTPNQPGLNSLDGYSLTAPWRVLFASPILGTTLNASTVRVIEVTLSATNVPTPVRPLVFGTDFTAALATDAGVGSTIVEIRPLRPLTRSGTGATPTNPLGNTYAYFVYLTNGITTAAGQAVTPDADYAAFRAASAATPVCGAVPASASAACQLIGCRQCVWHSASERRRVV